VCLYVTLINNTVEVVSFQSFVQFILHTAATVVWNHSYVTEMAPGQKCHTSQARFSYAAEPRALLCTGSNTPLSTNQRRACARWLSGLSSSMARTGTAWSRAPPLISFDCFYKPPLLILIPPYFSLTPNKLCTDISLFRCGVRWRHSKPPNSDRIFGHFYQFGEGSIMH